MVAAGGGAGTGAGVQFHADAGPGFGCGTLGFASHGAVARSDGSGPAGGLFSGFVGRGDVDGAGREAANG